MTAAAAAPLLTELLENTFYQAHAARQRVILNEHIEAAALEMSNPLKLQTIRWPSFEGRAQLGHVVKVGGMLGIVTMDTSNEKPFAVKYFDAGVVYGLVESAVESSGLQKFEFEKLHGDAVVRKRIQEACKALPPAIHNAMQVLRKRVSQDRLPLLSLLQAQPLHMQSSQYATAL